MEPEFSDVKKVEVEGFSSAHQLSWRVPDDFPHLNGHFPGNPIVPGVALIEVGIRAVQKIAGDNTKGVMAVRSAKFMKTVGPGTNVRDSGSFEKGVSLGNYLGCPL